MAEAGPGIGRAEAAQRRELSKAFNAALRRLAKATPWGTVQGTLFRNFDGWFLSAPATVWLGQRKTRIELSCKPMALDPLFWDIVRADTNSQLPLSFRYTGAWTCRTPPVVEFDIHDESEGPDALVSEALTWVNSQVGQFKTWTPERFLQQIQQHPKATSYRATVISTLLLLGDFAEAEQRCNEAISIGDECGFTVSGESDTSQSFPELALEWLLRKKAAFH